MSVRARVPSVVVALCFAVAVLALLFGGSLGAVLYSDFVLGVLQLLAYLLPIAGLCLFAAVLWAVWTGSRDGETRDEFVRSRGRGSDGRYVASELDRRLDRAAADSYQCEETYSIADVRERLEASAVRVLRVNEGYDAERARRALEAGTWTNDPVAGAFLSPRRGQPLGERLRGALDPGRAFHRRLERTVAAIEALETDRAGVDSTREPSDSTNSETVPTDEAEESSDAAPTEGALSAREVRTQ